MSHTNRAYFGGGCFWCLDAAFRATRGVVNVVSGYMGGKIPNPTYEQVSFGDTGHAEIVEIEYDPRVITYNELLQIFFELHDPTTKDRQGGDYGHQYRSVIFFNDYYEEQLVYGEIARLERGGIYQNIITEVRPKEKFWPAEDYHQRYFEKNPDEPYCQNVIKPKLNKLKNLKKK